MLAGLCDYSGIKDVKHVPFEHTSHVTGTMTKIMSVKKERCLLIGGFSFYYHKASGTVDSH